MRRSRLSKLIGALALLVLLPRPAAAGSRAPAVLLVLAHPDDETMAGGLLGRLTERGVRVGALYVTRGEGGKLIRLRGGKPVETEVDDARLARIRSRELARAARHFGIRPLVTLDEPDRPLSDAAGQPTRDATRFLRAKIWDVARIERRVVRLARRLRPTAVITLRPDVRQIHAHHQAIGRIVLRLFRSGRLGPAVQQVYAINELAWYPAALFGKRPGELRLPLAARSPVRGTSYGEHAWRGSQLHASQLVGHVRPRVDAEVVVPLGPRRKRRRDPLRALLAARPAP